MLDHAQQEDKQNVLNFPTKAKWELRIDFNFLTYLSEIVFTDLRGNSRKLHPSEKFTYIVLYGFRNQKTGRCHPYVSTIANISGQPSKSIRQNIRNLELAGLIERIIRRGKQEGGAGLSNTFIVKNPQKRLLPQQQFKKNNYCHSDSLNNCRHSSPKLSPQQPVTTATATPVTFNEQRNEQSPLPPQWGAARLKFSTGRKPRHGDVWSEWETIKERIQESIPEKDFEALLGCHLAIRDEGLLYLEAYTALSEFSETLKEALTKELSQFGFSTVRTKQ